MRLLWNRTRISVIFFTWTSWFTIIITVTCILFTIENPFICTRWRLTRYRHLFRNWDFRILLLNLHRLFVDLSLVWLIIPCCYSTELFILDRWSALHLISLLNMIVLYLLLPLLRIHHSVTSIKGCTTIVLRVLVYHSVIWILHQNWSLFWFGLIWMSIAYEVLVAKSLLRSYSSIWIFYKHF